MNNEKKSYVMLVLILLVVSIGLSFAYFSATLTNNETSTTITVTGGTMGIEYADNNPVININNIYPQISPVAVKTFTVTGQNTTDLEMEYYLYLIVNENTFSNLTIKYTLASTNTSSSGTIVPSIASQQGVTTGQGTYLLGRGTFTQGQDKVHTYNLNIYFPENGVNQNINQGKNIKAHVGITTEVIQATKFVATFGGSDWEQFNSVQQTSDGGYIAVGTSNSTDQDLAGLSKGSYDAIIVKYDSGGNVTWKQTFGGSGWEHLTQFNKQVMVAISQSGVMNPTTTT